MRFSYSFAPYEKCYAPYEKSLPPTKLELFLMLRKKVLNFVKFSLTLSASILIMLLSIFYAKSFGIGLLCGLISGKLFCLAILMADADDTFR
jgi:hypothetical protein